MTSKQIEIFLSVAKFKNFTLAANALFMSQPTISRQISLLEEELGMELFVRGNNFLTITPQGEILERAFHKTQLMIDKEIATAHAVKNGHIGTLTVGFVSEMSIPDFLIEAIHQFRQKYPGVTVNYVCHPKTTFPEDLQNHLMDVLLTHNIGFSKFKTLDSTHILTTHFGIYYGARHPLANKPGLSFPDFQNDVDWTIDHSDTVERKNLHKKLTDFYNIPELTIKLAYSTNEILYQLRMGVGFSIMDSVVLKNPPSDMRILRVDPDLSKVELSLFWDRENANPCIPLFIPLLKNSVQSYEN